MTWTQTYTGKIFRPLEPKEEDIEILDIAHALSLQCRYCGHCLSFYSVAQHCVIASYYCSDPKWALLHDAAEAYLSDIPGPIKFAFPKYIKYEEQLLKIIAKRFGLNYPIPEEIKEIDRRMLLTEQRDVMGPLPISWEIKGLPLDYEIIPKLPWIAEQEFLYRFYDLFEDRQEFRRTF